MSQEEIEQEEQGPVMVEIFTPGDILYYGPGSRVIPFFQEVTSETILPFISQLLELDSRSCGDIITIHLNTPGGSLTDAFVAYDIIKTIKSPVVILCTGMIASAGLILLSAGDYRYASPNCMFFYHQPILPLDPINSTEASLSASSAYKMTSDLYDEVIRKRSKITKGVWKKEFEGKTTKYFDTEEALKYKFIDEIIPFSKKRKIT